MTKSAYIKSLEADCAAQRGIEDRARISPDSGGRLRDEVARWHAMLPAELRQRPYTMAAVVREFHASPMALGRALAELGWIRQRSWRGPGPYMRYWVSPS